MALNIKNLIVEQLAAEVAKAAGETKTMAIRRALEERKSRLAMRQLGTRRRDHLRAFLEREIWPLLAEQPPITREERAEILGYGEGGI